MRTKKRILFMDKQKRKKTDKKRILCKSNFNALLLAFFGNRKNLNAIFIKFTKMDYNMCI